MGQILQVNNPMLSMEQDYLYHNKYMKRSSFDTSYDIFFGILRMIAIQPKSPVYTYDKNDIKTFLQI